MILGRPTNLWLGLVTAILGFATVIGVNVLHLDAVTVATVTGSMGGVLGALILLVANQPPTVNEGDRVNIVQPGSTPNIPITASIPPLEPAPAPSTQANP